MGIFNTDNINTGGLTANTISATTYFNLPIDIRVTGGTYSSGTATFTNNTGGTFTVSGFTSGSSGGIIGISNSGGTYTYYSTLTSAMSASTSGNTILFFTDIVETTNTEISLKDGVDINFNGYSYTLNTTGTSSCFSISYTNGTNRFYNGRIRRIGGTVSNSNSCCILITSTGSGTGNLIFNGVEVYSSFGVGISSTSNTVPYIQGATIRTYSHGAYYNTGVLMDSSNVVTNGGGYGCYAKTITNSYFATTGGGNGIHFPYNGSANNCYSYVSGTGSGYGIFCQSGVQLNNCTAISTRNSAIYNFAAISFATYGYSTAGASFECGSVAGGQVINCYGYSTGGQAFLYADTVSNSFGYSTSSRAVEGIIFGVTSNVYNSYLLSTSLSTCSGVNKFSNNVVLCNWNNVGGHGVVGVNNNVITNNSITVTNSSANCINGGSITLKYSNNVMVGSSTPVSLTITQGITNTQDNQGNILI